MFVSTSQDGPHRALTKDQRKAPDQKPEISPQQKAAWIQNDPGLVKAYLNTDNVNMRDNLKKQMSPEAYNWAVNLSPTEAWAVKNAEKEHIAAHLSGQKLINGVSPIPTYHQVDGVAVSNVIPFKSKGEPKPVKTVAERVAERTAAKQAKAEVKFGGGGNIPRVANEDEISPLSQAALPEYLPPVPAPPRSMMGGSRPAMQR
ncbi:hypothetical protein [Rhizobium ruizarguesonis]|uniref:hypothetical protein n=1 Tax=Rhizobium ruizarguesonis TaxID=2081791 RepID=UPI00103079FD|nr:hypothetical protein [Rhizobium ruizarguesonis]TBD12765.1 hypothetical protein ELH20_32930 [Rhizobium ruizarguesonis]